MGENGSQSAVKNNNLNNASAAKDSTNLAKTAENESSILESLAISTQRKKANAMIMQTRQFIPSSFANCVNCGAIVFRVSQPPYSRSKDLISFKLYSWVTPLLLFIIKSIVLHMWEFLNLKVPPIFES